MSELELTVTRTIAAPAKALFDAWLDPRMLAKFMRPAADVTIPHVQTDPVEGGRFDIMMATGGKEIPHYGIYKRIAPHSELVFTWISPFSIDGSTVTLTFAPVDGGTEVKLHHVRFPSAESRDNHQSGWTGILDALGATI